MASHWVWPMASPGRRLEGKRREVRLFLPFFLASPCLSFVSPEVAMFFIAVATTGGSSSTSPPLTGLRLHDFLPKSL